MSNRNVIKNTVKVLTINKPNQKIRFQIRHPENVYAIIGIAVTCSLTADGSIPAEVPIPKALAKDLVIPIVTLNTTTASTGNFPISNNIKDVAGHLTLAITDKGDVVYTDDVRIDNNDYSELVEKNLIPSFVPKEQYLSGKGKFYFETKFLVTDAILEGYYEDLFFPKSALSDVSGYSMKNLYQVNVYIRYQTTQEIES